jgi:Pentapeptide repeats (8 copies)/CHAT domain
VRDLLISHRGSYQSYAGRILKGAYLAGADLQGTDFTEAELSHAVLVGAQLEGTNLTRSQAIGTQFQQARMTAACLESWNIDSTTQLDGIHCEYIYLLNVQQERRPSDGVFRSGEFTKLFREVINTIDLIFNNGIDWKAFSFSFQQLQIDYAAHDSMVRSVENKGEGMTVIKVAVDSKADKQRIQASFTHQYQFALQVLEEKYRAELNSKDEQIVLYRQHQADLQALTQVLARQPTEPLSFQPGKLVLLKIGKGDFTSGFPVTLQISVDGLLPSTEQVGALPPAPSLLLHYDEWRSAYHQCLHPTCRIKVTDTQITNVSRTDFLTDCTSAATLLQHQFNQWLNSEEFRPVKEQMLAKLDLLEPIRIVVQTDDSHLQRLPWSTWELCDRYPTAEVALAQPCYEFHVFSRQPSKLKVLAILGDSTGIDVQRDRQYLEHLSYAEVTFLIEPERSQVNEQLWAQSWDILFFAGHSSSAQESGVIHLNASDSLSLSQLRYGLRQAIRNGLELAIFNSCDGLGLARELADLQLPQMIVMREPVPDRVAHVFLRSLLKEYASPLPFYQKVRSAREQLQGLEKEFPCATWLPVIYQNPAALFEPRSAPL